MQRQSRQAERMRRFSDTYAGDEKLAPLVRAIGWTHNLIILERYGGPLKREFDFLESGDEHSERQLCSPAIVVMLPSDLQGQRPAQEQVARLQEEGIGSPFNFSDLLANQVANQI